MLTMNTMKRFGDFVSEASIDISMRSKAPFYFWGAHVRYWFYFHVIFTTIVNIIGITLGTIAILYPNIHRESPIYSQILKHYERLYLYSYNIGYLIFCSVIIALFACQIISSIVAIVGTKLRSANLILPHIIVVLLHCGALILLLTFFIVVNFLLDRWIFVCPIIVIAFSICTGLDLFITVATYRYVRERQELMAVYTANTKQVHFRKNRRRAKPTATRIA
uniref:Uncharacterized protein n=1 Tax=Panagrellus redivivus TaxID=6233 RepID=A0A7E4VF98_PANRE